MGGVGGYRQTEPRLIGQDRIADPRKRVRQQAAADEALGTARDRSGRRAKTNRQQRPQYVSQKTPGMREIGADLSRHHAKSFDDLDPNAFDLVVSLTPEAQHRAVEMTRSAAVDIDYWPTHDPTLAAGSRPIWRRLRTTTRCTCP